MWVRLLQIPYSLLFPAIVLFTCVGVSSVHNSTFDIWVLLVFGAIGYLMVLLKLGAVPMLLGLILGAPLEENLWRALLISRGDFAVFFTRRISAVVLGFTFLLLAWSVYSYLRASTAERAAL